MQQAGLVGFTKSLARELGGRGVRANLVAPGFIETDMTAALPAERRAEVAAQAALGRLGTVGDVAAAVAFLCSPAASYITGQARRRAPARMCRGRVRAKLGLAVPNTTTGSARAPGRRFRLLARRRGRPHGPNKDIHATH